MEPLNIRIPSEDYRKLEAIATDTGVTLSEVGREAIARYVGRAGVGTRTKARLDRLESQVNRLTLMLLQPGGDRAEIAANYLDKI